MSYTPPYIDKTLVTTTATPTIDYTVPMLTNDMCYVEVTYMGSTANGAATIIGQKGGFFKNVAGTSIACGSVTNIILTVSDPALNTASLTITPNGANAIITIIGVAGTTITWNYLVTVYRKPI